jgi:hypothetical protein
MNPLLAVLGAHGGAGARTVTELLRIGGLPAVLVQAGDHLPPGAVPALVARSTAPGLTAAADFLSQWHPDVPRPWLILVADVPAPPPPAVRYRIRVVRGMARGMVEVPFLWPLRAVDHVEEVATAKPVARAAARLCAALASQPSHPTNARAAAEFARAGAGFDLASVEQS